MILNSENYRQRRAIQVLPFFFMLHNAEELWSISTSDNVDTNPLLVNNWQFTIAVTLFTILGFVLVFGRNLYRNNHQYNVAIIGFSGMLFLNSFFPHISLSIVTKAYTPGLISAIILILPTTTYILWEKYKSHILSTKQFIITVGSGGLLGLLLVFLFLGIGYLITSH